MNDRLIVFQFQNKQSHNELSKSITQDASLRSAAFTKPPPSRIGFVKYQPPTLTGRCRFSTLTGQKTLSGRKTTLVAGIDARKSKPHYLIQNEVIIKNQNKGLYKHATLHSDRNVSLPKDASRRDALLRVPPRFLCVSPRNKSKIKN